MRRRLRRIFGRQLREANAASRLRFELRAAGARVPRTVELLYAIEVESLVSALRTAQVVGLLS